MNPSRLLLATVVVVPETLAAGLRLFDAAVKVLGVRERELPASPMTALADPAA